MEKNASGIRNNKDGLNNEAGSPLNVDRSGSYSGITPISNVKTIGPKSGRITTYKTSVAALNTGSQSGGAMGLGNKYGLGDRSDA